MSKQPTNGHRVSPDDGDTRELFVLGRTLSRRDVLRLTGGMAGMVAVQALLAACGDDDDDDDDDSDAVTGSPTSAPDATAAATQPGDDTAEGPSIIVNAGAPPEGIAGELTVAIAFDPTSLDPIDTYTLNNGRWQSNVYSPLVWRDLNLVVFDGEEDRPAPSDGFGLAESWQYDDDLTLSMKLRSGITFHNGEAFNAESVRSTFTRLLDEANASPQAFNYTAIKEVQVVDDTTVKFIFNEVDPVMVTKLAGYGAFITPAEAVSDDATFNTAPAGTGPYQVTEYVKDDHLTLEAWDEYWGPRKPHVQKFTYRIIPDDNTRLSEFLAGSVDVLTLNVSQADAAQGNPNVQVVDIGVPTVSGLRLDASKPPTDNLQIRQAIAHAIDTQTIVDTILGGFATPVGIWQSPFSFGYEDLPPYEFDPDLSRQLIEESGIATPIAITYDLLGNDTQAREIGNAVKDMLDAVGFDVTLEQKEAATYFDDYRAGKLGNIVPFGWGGWTLDYDNTYYSMHYTAQSYNPSYSNPAVDALLDEERGTLDQARRLEIAKEVNKLLYDDAIDVMLYQNTYLWGVSNRVKNFSIPPDERLFWIDAWVEE